MAILFPLIKIKFPILIKGNDHEQVLLFITKRIYGDLGNEIGYLIENFAAIRKLMHEQQLTLNQLILLIEQGAIIGNASKTSYFEQMERLHAEELELIKKRGKSGKERIKEILMPLRKFLQKMSSMADGNTVAGPILGAIKKNPRLAAIYAPILPMPTLSTGGMIGIYLMGPLGYPIFWGITFALEFGPAVAYIIYSNRKNRTR